MPEPGAVISHHVAFIVNNYPPHVGGVEQHVASLGAHLVAHGHRVTVITLGRQGDQLEDGIRVVGMPSWLRIGDVLSLPLPGTTRRILALLRDTGVTAVSTHTRFFPMTTVGVAVARGLGVPLVHTEHGSDHVRGVSPLVAVASRVVDHTFGRAALRRARVVLAVSDPVAAFVARLARVRARVFYNAIDLAPWTAAALPARRRLVFVGRLVAGKGWPEVVRVATEIGEGGRSPVDVAFYGDGPEADGLHRALAMSAIGTSAAMGRVNRDVLSSGVAGAVLVNPTTLAEGFQTSLIEVVAAGGRVVTYPVAGADILAADGAPVRIVEPTLDALTEGVLAELESPSPLYPADRLDRWSWTSRAAEYAALLNEISATDDSGL